jgi:hypothetical protein
VTSVPRWSQTTDQVQCAVIKAISTGCARDDFRYVSRLSFGDRASAAGDALDLAANNLQHDQLPGGELVGKCDYRLLVVADEHPEYVNAGVDGRYGSAVRHAPHPQCVVAGTGNDELVVIGYGATPDLNEAVPDVRLSWKHRFYNPRNAFKYTDEIDRIFASK